MATIELLDLIMAAAAMAQKKAQRHLIKRYGLTFPQYELLLSALADEKMTLGSMAEDLNCSRGNLTGVADRLERNGWLKRQRSREDRRVINVTLTPIGLTVAAIRENLHRTRPGIPNPCHLTQPLCCLPAWNSSGTP